MNIVQAECINKINNTITIQITVESLYPDTVIEVAEYYNDTQLTDWINGPIVFVYNYSQILLCA